MGDCLIPAVANYRQMRQLGFQLRHRVAHDEPLPNAAQHLAVVHRIAEGHALLQGEA